LVESNLTRKGVVPKDTRQREVKHVDKKFQKQRANSVVEGALWTGGWPWPTEGGAQVGKQGSNDNKT